MQTLEKPYANFIQEAELFFVTKFITSSTIKKMFQDCLDIMFDITKAADAGRGIIAYNKHYGQGKTFFFDVANHRFRRKYGRNYFVKTSAKQLAQIYKDHGEEALLKFISCKNLFIDDIGDEGENKVFKHYSNQMNVLRWVILKRYEFWTEKGWKTFGTTNLSIEQIANEYDGRVADRIEHMTHWMDFSFMKEGKSFRQFDGTRRLTPSEVEANWNKFRKPVEEQRVDVIKYLNELLQEDDEYLNTNDFGRWNFVKSYLVERSLIDVSVIDEETLKVAEVLAYQDANNTAKSQYSHAGEGLKALRKKAARDKVGNKKIQEIAECILVKKKIIELKQKNYVFKPM